VAVFPITPAYFLILDNLAKQAAAGAKQVSSPAERLAAVQRRIAGEDDDTRSVSDRIRVKVGPVDQMNASIFAAVLVVSYGSQVFLVFLPLTSTNAMTRSVLVGVVILEAALAFFLAVAATSCLGGVVWRRARVVFANRASLWFDATARRRPAPKQRPLPQGRTPSDAALISAPVM
jgi:hypothetical protein